LASTHDGITPSINTHTHLLSDTSYPPFLAVIVRVSLSFSSLGFRLPFYQIPQNRYLGFLQPRKNCFFTTRSELLVIFLTVSFTTLSSELVNLWDIFPAVCSLLNHCYPSPQGFFSLYPSGGEGLEPSTLGQPLRNFTGWTRIKPNRDWPVTLPYLKIVFFAAMTVFWQSNTSKRIPEYYIKTQSDPVVPNPR
jgi:hypothetical protein